MFRQFLINILWFVVSINLILIVNSRPSTNDIIYFPSDYDELQTVESDTDLHRIYFEDDKSALVTPQRQSRPRKSAEKCNKYISDLTNNQIFTPLISDPPTFTFNQSTCEDSSTPLIVGGTEASVGEFPHMVAIGWTNALNGDIVWRCAGSLISERYILTAAHCVTRTAIPPDICRLGVNNLIPDANILYPQDFLIDSIVAHPEFKFPHKYHDIAVIKLVGTILFQKNLRPACLWQSANINYTNAVASGWGLTDFAGQQSDKLLKVVLHVYDNRICRMVYNVSRTLTHGISASQICAGDMDGGRDTCMGDSGGPLQVSTNTNTCVFHIVGITSFGKFCGSKNTPGIYTRVSMYLDWIESIVWP